MFFLVAVRKGVKFTNIEWISLLNSFLWFLGVEIKWHDGKIRLGQRTLFWFCRLPSRELCESQLPWRGVWMAMLWHVLLWDPAVGWRPVSAKGELPRDKMIYWGWYPSGITAQAWWPRFSSRSSWNPALQSPWGLLLWTPFSEHILQPAGLCPRENCQYKHPHTFADQGGSLPFPSALKRSYYGEAALWAVLQGSAGNPCSVPGWELTPELGRLHTYHFAGELGA